MELPKNEDGLQPVVMFAVRPPDTRVLSTLGFFTERYRVQEGDDDEDGCSETCEADGIAYLKEGWYSVHLGVPRPLNPNYKVVGWADHPDATEGYGSSQGFGF